MINMLYNSFTAYKNILKTFTIEEQLKQVEATINQLATRKHKGNTTDDRYKRLKELKDMKKLLSNNVL